MVSPPTRSPKFRQVALALKAVRLSPYFKAALAVCSMPCVTNRVKRSVPQTGFSVFSTSLLKAWMVPPTASEPYCTEPPPRKTSILPTLNTSIVLKYWLGPDLTVALLRRIPSYSSKVWFPVKPLKKGDPPPWLVFCTNTPGANSSASGAVRN